jgi:hypothetical protein
VPVQRSSFPRAVDWVRSAQELEGRQSVLTSRAQIAFWTCVAAARSSHHQPASQLSHYSLRVASSAPTHPRRNSTKPTLLPRRPCDTPAAHSLRYQSLRLLAHYYHHPLAHLLPFSAPGLTPLTRHLFPSVSPPHRPFHPVHVIFAGELLNRVVALHLRRLHELLASLQPRAYTFTAYIGTSQSR